MKGGSSLKIENVYSRVVSEQVVDDVHVSSVSSDEQRSPSDRALSVESFKDVGRRHVTYYFGEDLVVTGLGTVVEGRLLALLGLQGYVGPTLEQRSHDSSIVAGLQHIRGLDLGRVVERARPVGVEAVNVVSRHVRAFLVSDEVYQVVNDVRSASTARQVQRRLAVLKVRFLFSSMRQGCSLFVQASALMIRTRAVLCCWCVGLLLRTSLRCGKWIFTCLLSRALSFLKVLLSCFEFMIVWGLKADKIKLKANEIRINT